MAGVFDDLDASMLFVVLCFAGVTLLLFILVLLEPTEDWDPKAFCEDLQKLLASILSLPVRSTPRRRPWSPPTSTTHCHWPCSG